MVRKKNKRVLVTIPDDTDSIIRSASIERAKEGEAIGERAMLDRLLRVGAIMGTRCQGCRSGKCPRHVAMARGPSTPLIGVDGEALAANEGASSAVEVLRRLDPDERVPSSTVPLNLDKPGKITGDLRPPVIDVVVAPKTFVLATVEPVKKPERKKRAPSIKCTYPEGFALTDDMCAYAAKHGIGPDRVEKVFENFSIYHRSKGTKFVDWTLAFYTWARNDSEYGPRLGAPTNHRALSTAQLPTGKKDYGC